MRVKILSALVLVALFCVCANDLDACHAQETENGTAASADHWSNESVIEILKFDNVQRTCALEVIVRTFALEGPIVLRDFLGGVEGNQDYSQGEPVLACNKAP